MKKNKGITLIALVITIIVLLILAGVALSMVAGNEGILTKAETAVTKSSIASAREQAEILIAEIVADYYEKRYVEKNDEIDTQIMADYIKAEIGEGKTSSTGEYYIIVKDGAVMVYSGDGASAVSAENKITMGLLENNGKVNWIEIVEIPEGLEVGDTVTYTPSGTYNWEAEYASSDLATDGTEDVALATGTAVTADSKDMSITSWKVFSIDENTGKIELVPSAATTNTVRLQGPQGYNNAVKLLNDACSSLYGNGSTITARSINMDDIEGWMTETALAKAHAVSAKWGKQIASAYTSNKQYPTIYAKEKLSVINGEKNTTGLGMSEQTALIGRTDEDATDGKLVASTSIQPYQTYWRKDNSFMQTAFKGDGYNLLIPSGTSTNYWVASRCVYASSGYCCFDVSLIISGAVGAYWMCHSNSDANYDARALFPVVSLSSNILKSGIKTDWVIE